MKKIKHKNWTKVVVGYEGKVTQILLCSTNAEALKEKQRLEPHCETVFLYNGPVQIGDIIANN